MSGPWLGNLNLVKQCDHPLSHDSDKEPAWWLGEDGSLSCPHHVAFEEDRRWRDKRLEFAAKFLFEGLAFFDTYGWDASLSDVEAEAA